MEDQPNNGATPPTPEEAARIAAVDARRIADRDRKRVQRAREKAARESSPAFQKRIREESLAEITRRQAQERREREALIWGELTPPIQPDEPIEGTGESYWKWFLGELEIYIDEQARGAAGSWELFYYRLSETTAGNRVLEFFGVEPLDTNDGKFYLALVHQPSGPPVPVFTNLTPEERDAVTALHQVWHMNRKAKKDWKP